jgi:hypothetical protein
MPWPSRLPSQRQRDEAFLVGKSHFQEKGSYCFAAWHLANLYRNPSPLLHCTNRTLCRLFIQAAPLNHKFSSRRSNLDLMIELTKPAIPVAAQGGSNLTQDPSFCGICLNFSPVVAEACHGGRENLYLYNVNPKTQVWDFSSTFAGLLAGVNDDCGSCRVIKEAIDGVFLGRVNWGEEVWAEKELNVTMSKGNVLRIYFSGFFDHDGKCERRDLSPNVSMIYPNSSIELYCRESG